MPESQHSVSTENDNNSVTVVVCAYTRDRWATLQHALGVALAQTNDCDELVVIVDHNEALLTECRESFDKFKIFPNHHRRGLSGARNTALEIARGSIIVFLDDDAIPLKGWLDTLRAPYIDKRVYGVGGLAKPRWSNGRPGWFPEEFLWVIGCSHRGLPTDPQPVRNLVGANMSFRRAAFDRVGGFTEQLGRVGTRLLGGEDTEFSIRLTQSHPDALILYEPSSQVEHQVAQQRASLRYFLRRCWAEGLSKAEVSRRVGRASALSAERYYVSRVLPKGIWNGLQDSVAGDIWGVTRSMVIVLGFAATATGYCVGTIYYPADRNQEA